MFGMGFTEILVIAVIAILFLGPDKLPQTMIDIARFFRSAKRTLASAKSSIEEELHMEDIKREVDSYKNNLLEEKSKLGKLSGVTDLAGEFDTVVEMASDTPAPKQPKAADPYAASKPEVVTFSKKKSADTPASPEEGKDKT